MSLKTSKSDVDSLVDSLLGSNTKSELAESEQQQLKEKENEEGANVLKKLSVKDLKMTETVIFDLAPSVNFLLLIRSIDYSDSVKD